MIEIMTYLYGLKMNIKPESMKDLNRDVFILSKGMSIRVLPSFVQVWIHYKKF